MVTPLLDNSFPVPYVESHSFQLRAYLYQARDLYGSDKSCLSDPYAIVSFGNHSQRSAIKKQTLCPIWNETLIVRELKIYGDINFIKECQKIESITVSLWDEDKVCMCSLSLYI